MSECPDPFHTGESDGAEYDVPGTPDGFAMTGFRCPTCGFESVRTETYIPTVKPCPRCSRDFEGMPDVPDELCDQCFQSGLEAYFHDRQGGQ